MLILYLLLLAIFSVNADGDCGKTVIIPQTATTACFDAELTTKRRVTTITHRYRDNYRAGAELCFDDAAGCNGYDLQFDDGTCEYSEYGTSQTIYEKPNGIRCNW